MTAAARTLVASLLACAAGLGNTPAHASGFGDWSEMAPSLARVGSAILPELTVRGTDEGAKWGMAWEFPLVFQKCDPRWCNRFGSRLEPRSITQFSTVPAFRWYPSAGKIGGRLTERFWLVSDTGGWSPAVSVGAGWFSYGETHGPVAELRLWIGDVMWGSVTRGRSVGFFVGGALERTLRDEPLRGEVSAGIEAPIYIDIL